MRKFLSPALALGALCGFLALVSVDSAPSAASAPATEDKPCYTPVIPIADLMDTVGDTFDEIAESLEDNKTRKARRSAYLLAELFNVVPFHKSEEVTGDDKMKKWKEIAVRIRDDLVKLAQAAQKKDAAGAKKLHSTIEETCETCHDMRE